MKKIFLLCFLSLSIFANAEHMKFKGVEINGSMKSFVKQMEEKGFTKVSDEGIGMMIGKFTGQDVALGIYETPMSKQVSRVMVMYYGALINESWDIISNQYHTLKGNLTEKYGKPTDVIEKFEYPYSEKDHPLFAFKQEKAEYKTRFEAPNGGVTLMIIQNQGHVCTAILYWDKENEDKWATEVQDDL